MLLFGVLFPLISSAAYVIPLPDGPYGVSRQSTLIVDQSVHDPYLNLSYSRVPISIIAPTGPSSECQQVQQPYMPNSTAEYWEKALITSYKLPVNHTITETQLTVCKPNAHDPATPVIFLVPAAGFSQYFYHILATSITARTGFTIVTLDIPGQTEVVTFPDGSIEYHPNATVSASATNPNALRIISQDIEIVLDALQRPLPNLTLSGQLNVSHVGIFGHSEGGAAALASIYSDARFIGGANLDGGFLEVSLTNTTTLPFMIIAHEGNNQSTADWAPFWQNMKRDKWQVEVNATQHDSFGDFGYLLDLYGVDKVVPAKELDALLGSLAGKEVIDIVTKLLGGFFKFVFGLEPVAYVDDVAQLVEEVTIVNVTTF